MGPVTVASVVAARPVATAAAANDGAARRSSPFTDYCAAGRPVRCTRQCAAVFEDFYFRCHLTFERHTSWGADPELFHNFMEVCQRAETAVPPPPPGSLMPCDSNPCANAGEW